LGGQVRACQFERNEAVRLLRWALSVDDGDPDTLAVAAVISAFMVGDSESEIEMADRAVALNPNSYLAWHGRGWVYEVAGLPEEAVRSFERAIRMSPIDPLLHRTFLGMGSAFIELRRFDEAIEESPSSEPLLFASLPLSRVCLRPPRT
jgi:adenylate cyclase